MSPWENSSPPGVIEPELQGRVPRSAHYTFGTQVSRLLLLLLLIGSIWLVSWLATLDLNVLAALQAHGAAATAHVMGKRESHGKSTTYYLDYSFKGGGEDVDDDETVSWSEYNEANIGDPLPVTYLPSHPETHRVGRVDDGRVSTERINWTLGVLATLAVFGGLLWATEAGHRNCRRLLEEGVPVVGTVTDRNVVQGKNTTYYVTYRFEGPGGNITKRVSVSRKMYEQSVPDQPLTILYDPARPNNSQPYRAITDVVLNR